MVALLISHITLHTPAPATRVRKLFQAALDARACEPADGGNTIAINYGISQLHLVCAPDEPTSEAELLFAEAFPSSRQRAAAAASALEPQPLAGHLEMWSREPLEAVCERVAPLLDEDSQPSLVDGPDARLLFHCPWGNRLLIRHAPEGFDFRGELPGGHGALAAISRAVIAIRKGSCIGVRNFFCMVLGSSCDYKTAGPPDNQVAFCIAALCSGQQIVFEERADEQLGEMVEVEGEAGKTEPARKTYVSIYLQSREAFRAAYLACGAAGCLVETCKVWDEAEASHLFRCDLHAPRNGNGAVVRSGVELELRCITHPMCPQGTGRRPGSGRMPGGFGAAAKSLAREKSSDGTRSTASTGSSSSATSSSKKPARPPLAPKAAKSSSVGGAGSAANSRSASPSLAAGRGEASPKPAKASPRPQGDGKGVKRR